MNTPVLLRDLSELIDGSEGERVSLFAKTLKDHFVYPVDIQVLSPKAELIMHQPDKDLPDKNRAEYYLTLLEGAAKGETVNLTESTQALDLSASD
ncbi:hypothetical protein F4Y93_12665 [Candidatus Poribacteria bacterium]|nr:hypothetical protein [Candidatus Poribacteria bacterium]